VALGQHTLPQRTSLPSQRLCSNRTSQSVASPRPESDHIPTILLGCRSVLRRYYRGRGYNDIVPILGWSLSMNLVSVLLFWLTNTEIITKELAHARHWRSCTGNLSYKASCDFLFQNCALFQAPTFKRNIASRIQHNMQ